MCSIGSTGLTRHKNQYTYTQVCVDIWFTLTMVLYNTEVNTALLCLRFHFIGSFKASGIHTYLSFSIYKDALVRLISHHVFSTSPDSKPRNSGRVHLKKNNSITSIIVFLFYLFFFVLTTAVPAPTDLTFGEVGSDTIEVKWVSPQVPNSANINNYLVRYHKSQ